MSNAAQKKLQAKEAERKRETARAAQSAQEAQRQAKELTQAAAGAGDPDERQKLLNRALEKEVEAENFGKTAKYLQTGAFQGLCAGAGLGGGIGVSLGVITGTIVGGTTSLVTGGLGAGLGLGVGAAHGPWFKVGSLMGDAMRKVTGDLPGWKATEEQKAALERMVYDVRQQDRPKDDELAQMVEGGSKVQVGKGYTGQREEDEQQRGLLQSGKDAVTSLSTSSVPGVKSTQGRGGNETKSKVQGHGAQTTQPTRKSNEISDQRAGEAMTPAASQSKNQSSSGSATQAKKPPTAAQQNAPRQVPEQRQSPTKVKKQTSAEQNERSTQDQQRQGGSSVAGKPRKPPRKLEVRSNKTS